MIMHFHYNIKCTGKHKIVFTEIFILERLINLKATKIFNIIFFFKFFIAFNIFNFRLLLSIVDLQYRRKKKNCFDIYIYIYI